MEILDALESYGIVDYILVTLGIWITALATVYVIGRMLGLLSPDQWRAKNIVATVVIAVMSYLYVFTYKYIPGKIGNIFEFFYNWLLYWGISTVSYTLIAMRLWDRVDNLLDRSLGKDKGDVYKTTGRRRKKK